MPSRLQNKPGKRPSAAAKTTSRENLPLILAGIGLFLLSAASLAFEVTLTHLYSLVFQYHYAFLIYNSLSIFHFCQIYQLLPSSFQPKCDRFYQLLLMLKH